MNRYRKHLKKIGIFQLGQEVIEHRINILDKLKEKPYSTIFFNNAIDVSAENILGLRQLAISISEFISPKFILTGEPQEGSIVQQLVYQSRIDYGLGVLQRYNLIELDYDYKFEGYNIYLNLNSQGPLFIRKCATVTIYYKESYPGQLDEFLDSFFTEFGVELILNEPLFLNVEGTMAIKKFIVEEYAGLSLQDMTDDFVCDAYDNLINAASIGMTRTIRERMDSINEYRNKYTQSLRSSLLRQKYSVCPTQYELDQYTKLLEETNLILERVVVSVRNGSALPYDIKDYYRVEQKPSQHNRYKVQEGWIKRQVIAKLIFNKEISSVINYVNMDILASITITMLHMELLGLKLYREGGPLQQYFRQITGPELRNRPILIKFALKTGLDGILHDMKEEGLISLHQMENFFGYRVTEVIHQEIKEDYLAWFTAGQEKFDDIQGRFISKWAKSFFNSLNYKGKSIYEIMRRNLSKYRDEDELLANPLTYMRSKGAVDDEKVLTVDGKHRGISKNNFFNLYTSQEDYKIRGNRRNKVIIKREEYIKQRIVINSSLDTFVPLSKINKFLSILSAGSGVLYYSNTKSQKAEHYYRLSNYLLFNKYKYNRWLCMPLDYSSYDHTITMGAIRATLEAICGVFNVPYLLRWFKEFEALVYREPVYFKELEGERDNNQYYKYGVMSGWKITSSIESMVNAIITYGVMRELGLNMIDFETMGDDLIIILDAPRLDRDQQLSLLEKVCSRYVDLGFKMNVPKNSVGYFFLEFLRITFRPGVIQGYPSRIIGALFYVKPGRAVANFGAAELLGVLNKVCKRYGCSSRKVDIAGYISSGFVKEDIRLHFKGYVKQPWMYAIDRKRKVDYSYKVDIRETPVFKRYIMVFGKQFEKEIISIIGREFVDQSAWVTKLRKGCKGQLRIQDWQLKVLQYTVSRYMKETTPTEQDYLRIPEYHMSTILLRILRNSHFSSIDKCRTYLEGVFSTLKGMRLISDVDYRRNVSIIGSCQLVSQVRAYVNQDKIGVAEGHIPALILSRYKESVKRGFKQVLELLDKRQRDFIDGILSGTKDQVIRMVLGKIMDMKGVMLGLFGGLPISMMAD